MLKCCDIDDFDKLILRTERLIRLYTDLYTVFWMLQTSHLIYPLHGIIKYYCCCYYIIFFTLVFKITKTGSIYMIYFRLKNMLLNLLIFINHFKYNFSLLNSNVARLKALS